LKTKFIAAVGVSLALAFSAAPVAAQTATTTTTATYPTTTPNATRDGTAESDEASGNVRGNRVLPGRIGGGRQEQPRPATREQRREAERRNGGRPVGPTPEENRVAAQTVATALGNSCQVTEATLLGARPEGGNIYEAACSTGPGYIFEATTVPKAADCVDLAGAAAMARESDPAADPGLQCAIPANQNAVIVIGGYAQQAGVTCQVDAGQAIAVDRYEVGCTNADGYWIERQQGAWVNIPCWELKLEGQTCRFSTEAESSGVWPTLLAGTEASACTVTQVREVGVERTGQRLTIYELKCSAGDGWMARLDGTRVVKRLQTCSDPTVAAVAGGCQLTVAAPAAAPAE
jgi:hypothetical protein